LKLQAILEADARWSDRMRIAEKPGILRAMAAIIAHSGDSWFWVIGLGIGWFMGDWETRYRTLHLIGGIIVTAILVMSLKLMIRRRRPEGEWGSIYRNTDPHSFPSGHAARAILLATMVCGMGPIWLALILLVWAPFVGLARVAMGVHYLSDIIAGGLLGLLIGILWIIFLL
jgi:undecaprenyl-diphosphatase